MMTVLCEVTADTTTSNWTAACQTVVFVILTVDDELQLDGCGFGARGQSRRRVYVRWSKMFLMAFPQKNVFKTKFITVSIFTTIRL